MIYLLLLTCLFIIKNLFTFFFNKNGVFICSLCRKILKMAMFYQVIWFCNNYCKIAFQILKT